ncbi:MAG: hypothetical protein WAL35_03200 [Acidimicrobiales bacterium]
MADVVLDVFFAKELAKAKANGTAPAKGTPEREALERAAKRVDPSGAIQKAAKTDYRARVNRGTAAADPLSDARFAARLAQTYSPVASVAVKARAEHDPGLASDIARLEALRAATRLELAARLPASVVKQLGDLNSDAMNDPTLTDECPACTGTGLVGQSPCQLCEGLGLVLVAAPDDDDEIAAAVAKARAIKQLARKLVKLAGPDAQKMAKSATGTLTLVTDSKRAKGLGQRDLAALRVVAAKALGVKPDHLKIVVQ